MTTYDSSTALIVVDMQNDFADPAGSLFVEGGERVVAEVNRQIIRATAAGAFVVYTQDWHPPSTPHFAKDGGLWPVHCVGGEWGARFHPQLIVAGPSIRKGVDGEDGYSGFSVRDPGGQVTSPTALRSILDQHGVDSLVVTGLALDYCVGATALDGLEAGFDVCVPLQVTAAVNLGPNDGDHMVARLVSAGIDVS